MGKLFVLALVLLVAGAAYGAQLSRDTGYRGIEIQGAAWDGTKTVVLTAASTIVDLSADIAYAAYTTAATCYVRLMPMANSNKAAYIKVPVLSETWDTAVVNKNTPFANYSGCSGGFLKRH